MSKWTYLAVGIITKLSTGIVHTSMSRLLPAIEEEYPNTSQALLMWIVFLLMPMTMFFASVSLTVLKYIGYFQTQLLSVSLFFIGVILFAISTNVITMVPATVLAGFGDGLLHGLTMFTIMELFPISDKYHVLSNSCIVSLYPISMVVGNNLSDILLSYGHLTWRQCLISYVFINLIFGSVFSCTVYRKLDNSTLIISNKVDTELVDDNTNDSHVKLDTRFKLYVLTVWNIVWFLKSTAIRFPGFALISHAINIGLSTSQGVLCITVQFVIEGIVRLIFCVVGDYLFKRRMLFVYGTCCFLLAVISAMGYFCTELWSLLLYSAFHGAMAAPILSGRNIIMAELFDKEFAKVATAVSYVPFGLGFMFGSFFNGLIFDIYSSYYNLFIIYSAFYFISLCLIGTIVWSKKFT